VRGTLDLLAVSEGTLDLLAVSEGTLYFLAVIEGTLYFLVVSEDMCCHSSATQKQKKQSCPILLLCRRTGLACLLLVYICSVWL
jgi:hypothetical protein